MNTLKQALIPIYQGLSKIKYYVFNASSSMVGSVLNKKIKAYWYVGRVNFGDLITPVLLKDYGFIPVHADPFDATIVSTGSILDQVPEVFSGYILGSRLISDKVRIFENAKYWVFGEN